ncbi:MAG: MBL fold metallo-hydrolase [Deltaproteobacteria bacterium]|nr:MAG: MBL fold metallo-hydrolase [Deltaproteobacteria bacterium]
MDVAELNFAHCKTYLVTDGREALLVDPVRERLPTYEARLAEGGLRLVGVVETHTHADHLMIGRAGKARLGAPVFMHRASPSPLVDVHVDEGDRIAVGSGALSVLHTPGHTPDSISLVGEGFVLTGDTLLIGGSGRTDFAGGDPGAQYDAITQKLFALPDETVVYPGHDYRGRTSSTIGEEKRTNQRLAGVDRKAYIERMNNLGLPVPERIQEVLQVNQSGCEAEEVPFPPLADLGAVLQRSPQEVAALLRSDPPPLVVDVREPEEFVGELGHVEGALLVPMDALVGRLPRLAEWVDRPVVVVCRAGARSRSAAALLARAGFRHVYNLEGGMVAWQAAGLPVQH